MPLTDLRPAEPGHRRLADVVAAIGAEVVPEVADVAVSGMTHDSRAVRAGDLYAALPGTNAHGADFAAQAAAAGAVAVLTDPAGRDRAASAGLPVVVVPDPRASMGEVAAEVYGRPGERLLLLGVTGTNGKTTTAYLLESGLRAAGHGTGLVGTVETRVRDDAVVSIRTTPEATDLHALLAVMLERDVSAVAMEVSSHAMVLGRVGGLTYDVAIFTNLSQDHLDFHQTLEAYYDAKASLFTPRRCRAAVVNIDDEYGHRLASQALSAGVPVTTFSAAGSADADWRAGDVTPDQLGSRFTVAGPAGRRAAASVRLPGVFNVENALAAIVALVTAGIELSVAVAGVASCRGVPGRMERVDAGQSYLAVVDYAHTPDAVATLLTAVREVTPGRLAVVLGCGGDRDRGKRPLMGEAAARLADLVVFTDDNPRSEDPAEILAAMRAGAESVPDAERADILVAHDRAQAIQLAIADAAEGDSVVVAGKGHEQGQEVAGVVRPFDDRVVLRQAIRDAQQFRRDHVEEGRR